MIHDSTDGLNPSDTSKLTLLRIAYYVLAVATSGAACMPILVVVEIGWAHGGARALVANAIIVLWMVGYAILSASLLTVARNIATRRGRTFNLVVTSIAAVLCLPLGTLIGAAALVTLLNPRIDAAFRST